MSFDPISFPIHIPKNKNKKRPTDVSDLNIKLRNRLVIKKNSKMGKKNLE
jgi:hypothetical protein